MEKFQKSGRVERRNKEKSKKNKFFGSQKHIRVKTEKQQNCIQKK